MTARFTSGFSGSPLLRRAILGGQYLVSLGLVAWALQRIDAGTALERLDTIATPPILMAGALAVLQVAATCYRWIRINAMIPGPTASGRWHARVTMIGYFFHQVLPATVGGDAYRVWALAREGAGFGTATVSVVTDRAVGFGTLLVVAAATLPLLYGVVETHAVSTLLAVVLGAIAFGCALVLMGTLKGRLASVRILMALTAPLAVLHRIAAQPAAAVRLAVVGVAVHLCSIGMFLSLADAIGVALPAPIALAIVPPVVLLSMLPVSVAGWGVREGGMMAGFALVGLAPADALLLSLMFGLLLLGTAASGAILTVFMRPAVSGFSKAPVSGASRKEAE